MSFVPKLPPELEEAKRAGMIATNPVLNVEEEDDQGDMEVSLGGSVLLDYTIVKV